MYVLAEWVRLGIIRVVRSWDIITQRTQFSIDIPHENRVKAGDM